MLMYLTNDLRDRGIIDIDINKARVLANRYIEENKQKLLDEHIRECGQIDEFKKMMKDIPE